MVMISLVQFYLIMYALSGDKAQPTKIDNNYLEDQS